jgi:hypothetical protein
MKTKKLYTTPQIQEDTLDTMFILLQDSDEPKGDESPLRRGY